MKALGILCTLPWAVHVTYGGVSIQKGSTVLQALESQILCHSPTRLPDPWAIVPPSCWPCSQSHFLPRTSTRAWTSGRDGPPARDTSIPPRTAGRACPLPSPAHLTTTTALVRKGDAPKGTGRVRGTTQWFDVPSCGDRTGLS